MTGSTQSRSLAHSGGVNGNENRDIERRKKGPFAFHSHKRDCGDSRVRPSAGIVLAYQMRLQRQTGY